MKTERAVRVAAEKAGVALTEAETDETPKMRMRRGAKKKKIEEL